MNNTPYTVPEGFFEDLESRVIGDASIRRRRTRAILLGAAGAVAALAVVLSLSIRTIDSYASLPDDLLADMVECYESDVFLSVNDY